MAKIGKLLLITIAAGLIAGVAGRLYFGNELRSPSWLDQLGFALLSFISVGLMAGIAIGLVVLSFKGEIDGGLRGAIAGAIVGAAIALITGAGWVIMTLRAYQAGGSYDGFGVTLADWLTSPVNGGMIGIPVGCVVAGVGSWLGRAWRRRRPHSRLPTPVTEQPGGSRPWRTLSLVAVALALLHVSGTAYDRWATPPVPPRKLAGFGDGGPATDAWLQQPVDIVEDARGGLLIADSGSNRVRRIDPNGTIATVAGSDSYMKPKDGFSGDGGPAVRARLLEPWSLALDAEGDLFVLDSGNGRVRKIDRRGIITTVAGSGPVGRSARRARTPGFFREGMTALQVRFSLPSGIAVDARGDLYISESHRILKIDPKGGVRTAAGTGAPGSSGDGGPALEARVNTPSDMAIDRSGNLYFVDDDEYRVRRIDAKGIITTVAGSGPARFCLHRTTKGETQRIPVGGYSGDGGPATKAHLDHPGSVDVDAVGNLYIADTWNDRVRKVTPAGIISTVAGRGPVFVGPVTRGRRARKHPNFSGDGGPATGAELDRPSDVIASRSGDLYIADPYNDRIRKVAANGTISTVAGSKWPWRQERPE